MDRLSFLRDINQERRGNTDGRVCTDNSTEKESKSEPLQALRAEKEKCKEDDEYRRRSEKRSAESIVDRFIDDMRESELFISFMKI
jgi:hypothetical protein